MFFLVIIGFIYRLFLSSVAYKRMVFDMATYTAYAKEILAGHWVVDCCVKNMGYPVFLAAIYRLFGADNFAAVRIIQIFLDICTALLIYVVGSSLFSKRSAFLAFFLYITNPFTSAFTGLILPESITLFTIALIAFIVTQRSWFFLGLLLGWLVFMRFSLIGFSIIFILGLTIFFKKRRLLFVLVTLSGFFLASSYSLIGNWQTYKKLSLKPPYTYGAQQLYTSFSQGRQSEVEFFGENPELTATAIEFENTPISDKPKLTNKYYALFFERLKYSWPVFIWHTIRNVFWLWDKDHLYTYEDVFYPADKWPLRILNLGLLSIGTLGLITFVRQKGINPLVLFTILLALYMSGYALVENESRHTLPFYALLFIWVAKFFS